MDVVVEPGIGWMELNEYLEPYGLFFPLDPGKLDPKSHLMLLAIIFFCLFHDRLLLIMLSDLLCKCLWKLWNQVKLES